MIDCFALLIKILSESVNDISVITRCENLLKCAETSREEVSPISASGLKFKFE